MERRTDVSECRKTEILQFFPRHFSKGMRSEEENGKHKASDYNEFYAFSFFSVK